MPTARLIPSPRPMPKCSPENTRIGPSREGSGIICRRKRPELSLKALSTSLPIADRRRTGTCRLASRGPQVCSLEHVKNRNAQSGHDYGTDCDHPDRADPVCSTFAVPMRLGAGPLRFRNRRTVERRDGTLAFSKCWSATRHRLAGQNGAYRHLEDTGRGDRRWHVASTSTATDKADLNGHGGERRAVFVYQMDSYRYWQNHLGQMTSSMGNSRSFPSMVCPMRRCALETATGSAVRYSR